ncbi:MAG: hypothetical protein AAF411_24900 [Myxococcota bacterium]
MSRDAHWLSDSRGGPLAAAAAAFAQWRGIADVASGTQAVRALADTLDDFAHDEAAPPSDDERFIEGGGAFLGMVLIAHHGGTHTKKGTEHRVLLGEHGCFDPFSAIDAALDADEPGQELSSRLRLAGAEAEGTGRVARVVRHFAMALSTQSPRSIRARFDYEVVLDDGVEVDLKRVGESTVDQGESAVAQGVRKLVDMLEGAGKHAEWSDVHAFIVPRLVARAFLDELAGAGRGELASRAIASDVCWTLQLRRDGRARYLRADEVARWREDAFATSQRNLARHSQGARFAHVDGDEGSLVIARTGDGLDSARLLLPTLRDVLEPELGRPFIAAVPHRDTLLAARAEDAALLQSRADDLKARAPHAISARLFQIDDQLRPLD